jgi:hypothetical protein
MASGEKLTTRSSDAAADLGRLTAICVTASLISSQESNDLEKGNES